MYLDGFIIKALKVIPSSQAELRESLLEIKEEFEADPSSRERLQHNIGLTFSDNLPDPPITDWQAKLMKLWSDYIWSQ